MRARLDGSRGRRIAEAGRGGFYDIDFALMYLACAPPDLL